MNDRRAPSPPLAPALSTAAGCVGAIALATAVAWTAPGERGALVGTVVLDGEAAAEPTRVANATDPEVCGRRHSLEDLLVDPVSRGIANVLLSLADYPQGTAPPEPQEIVLDNVHCRFDPHAAITTVGSTLEARNSDGIPHTVHLYGAVRANLSLPVRGMRRSIVLDEPGLVAVKCDLHGWMQAFIRVDPHPYHAVSDRRGRFLIEGVPAGRHTLELWHERLGRIERPVAVAPGETARIEIRYPAEPWAGPVEEGG